MQATTQFIGLRGATISGSILQNLTSGGTAATFIAQALNASLKAKLTGALAAAVLADVAAMVQNMGQVDIATVKDMNLRDFATKELTPQVQGDATKQKALDEALAKLSPTTTVGQLLGLDKPLEDHPLFQNEVNKLTLTSLLATSPAGANSQTQDKFISLYAQHMGSIADFWAGLRQDPAFSAPGVVDELQRTLQLSLLTQNNVPLVTKLQQEFKQGQLHTMGELAGLTASDWTQLVNSAHDGQTVSIPATVPGTTDQERLANYVNGMMATVRHAFPTAHTAYRVKAAPTLRLDLVNAVLKLNPRLDPSRPLPPTVNWGTLSAADQASARASLETLRQEINAFPDFDYNAALSASAPGTEGGTGTPLNNPLRRHVAQFLSIAPGFDLRLTNIDAYMAQQGDAVLQRMQDTPDRRIVANQLKSLQRVCRVSDNYAVMSALLGEGLDSAYRIVSMSQATFVVFMSDKLGGPQQAATVYAAAQDLHAKVLMVHAHLYQAVHDVTPAVIAKPLLPGSSGNSSGSRAGGGGAVTGSGGSASVSGADSASAGTDGATADAGGGGAGGSADGTSTDVDGILASWATLFGDVENCDCEDCRSVYSPAAYFVDLLHFLDQHPKSGAVTPLSVLLQRRPDLADIPLTCENTFTPVPYVDLVNEILESYVALTTTVASDTPADTTAAELSINPTETTAGDGLAATYYTNRDLTGDSIITVDPTIDFDWNSNPPPAALNATSFSVHWEGQVLPQSSVPSGTYTFQVKVSDGVQLWVNDTLIIDQWHDRTAASPTLYSGSITLTAGQFYPIAMDVYVNGSNGAAQLSWTPPGASSPTLIPQSQLYTHPAFVQDTADAAYAQLASALYPPTLPFDRSVETVRTYLEFLGSSRYEVMSTFQSGGDPASLYTGNPSNIAVACEYLMITERELGVLTGLDFAGKAAAEIPPGSDWLLYGYETETVSCLNPADGTSSPQLWYVCLTHVPEFLQRTGIVYTDLVELVKTRYVNPHRTLTLSMPSDCSLDGATINGLDADAAGRMQRFLRLWRKLGWKMSEVDQAIQALGVTDDKGNTLKLPAITDAFIARLAQAQQLQASLNLPVPVLMSFWSSIDTYRYDSTRDDSLYTALFQNKAVINPVDPAFALNAGRGDLATATSEHLFDHISTILAALRITAADLAAIRGAVSGLSDDLTASLNLANLTTLYRHAVLVHALGMAVKDLLALRALSGVDPFAAPDQTLLFTTTAQQVSQSGFSIAQLAYLYQNADDPTASLAPRGASVYQILQRLHVGLMQIVAATTVVPDPKGDLTRKSLGSLLGSDLAGRAVAMVDGIAVYSVSLASMPTITIPDPTLNSRVSYDANALVLRFTGAMTVADRATLLGLSTDAGYQAAINTLFQQPRDFVINNLAQVLTPGDPTATAAIAYLLDGTVTPPPAVEAKFASILALLLPYLRDIQSRTLVTQTIADALSLDSAVAALLLGTIIASQADPAHRKAMDDLLALRDAGIVGVYYNSSTLPPEGTPGAATHPDPSDPSVPADPAINFAWGSAAPDPQITPTSFSVRWKGQVLAPTSEPYTFSVKADNGVRLSINGQQIIDHWVDGPVAEQPSAPIALAAGQFYPLTLEYYHTPGSDPQHPIGATVVLSWSSPSTPKALVPSSQFYPDPSGGTTASALKTFTLLSKAALLVNTFSLSANEIAYLSGHSRDFAGFDLNKLPVDSSTVTSTETPSLFAQWQRLNALVTLHNGLPSSTVGLVDVFGAGAAAAKSPPATPPFSKGLAGLILAATRWSADDLAALTASTAFNLSDASFADERMLVTLQSCLALCQRLGVSAAQMWDWAHNTPDPNQAQAVKNTVKAKYDDQAWVTVAKPLSDAQREKAKAALIAYLLAQLRYTDSSQLFEHFLIDVDMSACMLTSRIDQAICSLQLFVQRCLLNLEQGVSPSMIDVDQWEQWRERYRIWEAAREVFLYPENWIDPTLRDDKTPFFKDLETQLMQADVTADTAEQAFLDYLEKLDQVARLEICGMYWEQDQQTVTDPSASGAGTTEQRSIIHVFGRTLETPHIYFYTSGTCDGNGIPTWSPWEKVDLDIEGDHLIPVVWNRRLHLVWLVFTEKSDPDQPSANLSTPTLPTKYLEIKLAWSEYKQNKWTPKQVSTDAEILISRNVAGSGSDTTTPLKEAHTFKALVDSATEDLVIQVFVLTASDLTLPFQGLPKLIGEFQFTGCHGKINVGYVSDYWPSRTPPPNLEVVVISDVASIVTPLWTNPSFMMFKDVTKRLPYYTLIPISGSGTPSSTPPPPTQDFPLYAGAFSDDPNPDVLMIAATGTVEVFSKTPSVYRVLYPHQYPQFALQAPFFFQDDQRTYFVTPTLSYDPPPQLAGRDVVVPPIHVTSFDPTAPQSMYLPPAAGGPPILVSDMRGIASAGRLVGGAQPPPLALATRGVPQTLSAPAGNTAGTPMRALAPTTATSGMVTPTPQPSWSVAASIYPDVATYYSQFGLWTANLNFATYFHPYVCAFIKALNWSGVPGLLTLCNQRLDDTVHTCTDTLNLDDTQTIFYQTYAPTANVPHPYPRENVDFSNTGMYSIYNWELFFHIPMLIASRLTQNQQFEDAQKWLHYIFDPTTNTDDTSQQRYWKVLPFYNNSDEERLQITSLLEALDSSISSALQDDVQAQIAAWAHTPFDPHLIARLRLAAYQKYVVMAYLDNLIAWGDQLFRQDTIESINQATQLYDLASHILGLHPQNIPTTGTETPETYHTLGPKLDDFSNAAVALENVFPFTSTTSAPSSSGSGISGSLLDVGTALYFCIPQNDKLLKYWDTVADRLYKIEHCMNIEGVVQQLPLFAPPINPALLVEAGALGMDLNSVLSDVNAATPYYRFTYLLQKAAEFCADVRALGGALLAALEKKDAEALSALRASQETSILKAIRAVKEQQIQEAQNTLQGLQKSREVTQIRYDFYANFPYMLPEEQLHLALTFGSGYLQLAGQALETAASAAAPMPGGIFGGAGMSSPVGLIQYGPQQVVSGLEGASRALQIYASYMNTIASIAATTGSYHRRADDAGLQRDLAAKELEQIDQQIAAAQIRATIAQTELDNQDKQIANATAIEAFLRDKYTNADLYDWMISQVSALYLQSYQLAYDMAKRAEMAFRVELGVTTSSYIQFGYWDSLKKGLLAGERLQLDLRRLEMAYLDQNRRRYELTRHISLALLNPLALIALKATGSCIFEIPEAFFDMDYPGHYQRMIEAVIFTMPCVAGPFTPINCTLTLLTSKVRISNDVKKTYAEQSPDDRFVTRYSATQAITTSHAQNDSGMFELSVRDERYLPFEGAGAISRWRVDLPKECNAFDFDTISDIILTMRYTALDGGDTLRQNAAKAAAWPTPAAQGNPPQPLGFPFPQKNLTRMFSAKHEYATDWVKFMNPVDPTNVTLSLDFSQERFPFQFRGKTITITQVGLYLVLDDVVAAQILSSTSSTSSTSPVLLVTLASPPSSPGGTYVPIGNAPLKPDTQLNGVLDATIELGSTHGTGTYALVIAQSDIAKLPSQLFTATAGVGPVRLNPAAVRDLIVVCTYSAASSR